LQSFIDLSEAVNANKDSLSDTSNNRFTAMSESLGITIVQAESLIDTFTKLDKIALGRDTLSRTNKLDNVTDSGKGADTQKSLGVLRASKEVEEANEVVKLNGELFKAGMLSATDYSDSVFKLQLAQAKLGAETEKLNRSETALGITRTAIGQARERIALASDLGTEQGRVALKQIGLDIELKTIEARHYNGELSSSELLNAKELLQTKQALLDREKEAAPFKDASAIFSSIQALDGLSELQSTGLDMATSFSDTFAAAAESGQGFSEFLMSNAEDFRDFSVSMANAATSIFSAISDEKIAGIDREIAAEKRRDGKSQESLGKIKRLEAKKIKEKAKSDKAQLAMSTAVSIMNAYKDLPYPANIAASVAIAALGMQQMSNIDKAASGSMAAIGASGGAGLKITGGNRDNSIDVSKSSNAGELSFLQGGMGQGTANNFNTPGRAGGGYSEAGTSIMVGERGPEMITPPMPVSVTPAGGVANQSTKPTVQVNIAIDAIDTQSFGDKLQEVSMHVYESLERELNANSQSLINVG
jgi:hypothetical protein